MSGVRIQTQQNGSQTLTVTWRPGPRAQRCPHPTAGTVLLGTPRDSSPEENHPLPKVVTLETDGNSPGQPCFLSVSQQQVWPGSFRETQGGTRTSHSHTASLSPHGMAGAVLAPGQGLPLPSKDFRGSVLPSRQLRGEHHHLSPLHPEAKPLSAEESRVLISLETMLSLHRGRQGRGGGHPPPALAQLRGAGPRPPVQAGSRRPQPRPGTLLLSARLLLNKHRCVATAL